MPDVTAVETDYGAKTATITAKAGTTITRDRVEAALQAAGYGVTSFAEARPAPGT